MVRALLYLRLTSLKNSLLSRIRRLRQPKYLFGAIAGAAYVWFFFLRHLGGPGSRSGTRAIMPEMPPGFTDSLSDTSPLVIAFGSLALFVIVAITWLLPSQKPGLGFTEAETAFLFPAPVSRRMLINFKLLNSQFTILFTSFFFTLVSNRWSFMGGNGLSHAIGWWVILSTLNLHFTGAALTLTRLIERGGSTARRRTVITGVIALAVIGTLGWMWRSLPAPSPEQAAEVTALTHYLLAMLNTGAVGWLLWPFRIVLGPFAAADSTAFFFALGPALLLMGAHYFWVMRLQEVSFEEASLTAAEKRTAVLAQARAGQYRFGVEKPKARRSPFYLRDTGRPEFAFLWKNLLSTRSYFNGRTFAVIAAIIVVGSRWLPHSARVEMVTAGVCVFVAVCVMLYGPFMARQDIRSDLNHADILKTYPIAGSRLLLGELLTPVAILTAVLWLAILAWTLVLVPTRNVATWYTPTMHFVCALCAAATAVPLIGLQLLVLNGATLLFPGWFQSGRSPGGIEMMGQRLIFFFGSIVVIFAALIPSVMAGASVLLASYGFSTIVHYFREADAQALSPWALLAAGLSALAILTMEVWCGIWWLGRRFENFDLSAELRP
ncbi:MAG: putative ABC exporter domain-containing protein [Opitutaceae bacterium]